MHQQRDTLSVASGWPCTANHFLGRIVAPLRARRGGLDLLAVEHASARAGLVADLFEDHHQDDVVDGAKQHQAHEAPKLPANHQHTICRGGKSFGSIRQPPLRVT